MRVVMTERAVHRTLLALIAILACAPHIVRAAPFCASCVLQIGVGGTYHYWGSTGAVVLPVTVSWSENRYEFGVFRMARQQTLADSNIRTQRLLANPYWGVSLSRRWQLFARGPLSGFIGFGTAYRTQNDELTATHWNFAEQLGARYRLPGGRMVAEFTVRHWSNAGIRLPNHGQDFATLTATFDF